MSDLDQFEADLDTLTIVPDDMQRLSYCISPGVRDWFASYKAMGRDLDFREFIKARGINARRFLEQSRDPQTGALAGQAVHIVRSRIERDKAAGAKA